MEDLRNIWPKNLYKGKGNIIYSSLSVLEIMEFAIYYNMTNICLNKKSRLQVNFINNNVFINNKWIHITCNKGKTYECNRLEDKV